jgi:hypothetical protein
VKPTLGSTVPAKKKEMINALLLFFSNDPAAIEIDVEDEEFSNNEEDTIES